MRFMGKWIKGITVSLITKERTGTNEIGEPIYEDKREEVNNVIVAQPVSEDVVTSLDLYGKRAEYTLGIPKDDTHNWEDAEVEFFGQRFRTFGPVVQGIDNMIPLDWNKKVQVESIE